jgi:acyl carrier protein
VIGLVLHRHFDCDRPIERESEPAWDSLKHLEIVFAVEDAFSVKFPEQVLGTLNSADLIVQNLERLLAA